MNKYIQVFLTFLYYGKKKKKKNPSTMSTFFFLYNKIKYESMITKSW